MLDSTIGCCIPATDMYRTAYYDGKLKYKGHNYQALHYDFGTCLVREEEGKVYVIGTSDSTERMIYNFHLGLNDTFRITYPTNTFISWVAEMDVTELYGISYKVWHFYGIDSNATKQRFYQYNVIEGIGCTNGVYYPASPYALDAYSDQLLCFKSNLGYTTGFSKPVLSYGYDYIQSFDNYNSCDRFLESPEPPPIDPDITLGTQSLAKASGSVIVVPNPANASSKLVLPYTIRSGSVVILNQLGQTISSTSIQNKSSLPLNIVQTPGNYFYRITDNHSGQVFSGKFVAQ